MALIAPTLPTVGDPAGPEEIDVRNALVAILGELNGNIDNANIKNAAGIAWSKMQGSGGLLAEVGSNADGTVRRGHTFIAGEESTSSATYATLATPDQVANVVVPANGVLYVSYLAGVKVSVATTISASIFIGANQLKMASGSNMDAEGPADSDFAVGAFQAAKYHLLVSSMGNSVTPGQVRGLAFVEQDDAAFTAFPTTGFVLEKIPIFVAAGTYTVSVRFKTAAGTFSAKDRRLYVETEAY